jgi:hypothetical protein
MTQHDEDPLASAERQMDDTARDMERARDELEGDIDESKKELEELREREGEAAESVAGDWRETEDEAGGDDPTGAGGSVDVERDDEAGRGSQRRG